MKTAAFAALVASFATIGLLPIVVFRRGRLTLMWWATALPFVLCLAAVIAVYTGALEGPMSDALASVAILAAAAAVALMIWTARTHRRPVAKWHQPDIEPEELVTRGPYRWVRHPFYASFQTTFVAACLAFPHPAVIATAAFGLAMMHLTARVEERGILRSPLGEEYAAYMRMVGRFFPGIGRHA